MASCTNDAKEAAAKPSIGSATKSGILLASLGPCAEKYFVPGSSAYLDLSVVSPRSVAAHGKRSFLAQKKSHREEVNLQRLLPVRKKTLISFLALYIMYLDPIVPVSDKNFTLAFNRELEKDAGDAFKDIDIAWLRTKGYTILDLTTWRWILSADSSERATTRLMVLAEKTNGFEAGPIPVFIILFVLRRRDMNGRALPKILSLISDRLLEQDAHEKMVQSKNTDADSSVGSTAKMADHLLFDQGSIMTMIVRLLRHARKVWPASLPNISALATKYLYHPEKTRDSHSAYAKLGFNFNALLSLLALPSSKQPFQSIAYHQKAQFNIIRRMAECEPALIIDRRGYRAIERVQIAHRKTAAEREWARGKVKSWPPWRKPKSGIDSDIDIEKGTSRAAEAIMRSMEAGYAKLDWEAEAKVFTGWDTDDSPTIQTRSKVSRENLFPARADSNVSAAVKDRPSLWSARIKATRTVTEAWACFLSYKESQASLPNSYSQSPYFAMFEKIIFEKKRAHLHQTQSADTRGNFSNDDECPLPGDGKETWPIPGPQEAIYVRTPVPDEDEFFQLMSNDGIVPGNKFLEFIVRHAGSLESCVKYLEASCLPAATTISLTQDPSSAEVRTIDIKMFSAYVHCLCRHSSKSYHSKSQPGGFNALEHTYRLMDNRRPRHLPPWLSLMSALRRKGVVVDSRVYGHNGLVQDSLAWSVMCHWLSKMRDIDLDMEFGCFHHLCTGLKKSTLASRELLRLLNHGAFGDDGYYGHEISPRETHGSRTWIKKNAERVLAIGLPFLKDCFWELVADAKPPGQQHSPDFETSAVDSVTHFPRLREVPHPVHLHSFIRILGIYHDYSGILQLVQWMDRFYMVINDRMLEPMNGMRAMKTLAVAIRVFLEGSRPLNLGQAGYGTCWATEANDAARQDIIDKVAEIIKRQDLWGGWPSDFDVENYILHESRIPERGDRIL